MGHKFQTCASRGLITLVFVTQIVFFPYLVFCSSDDQISELIILWDIQLFS